MKRNRSSNVLVFYDSLCPVCSKSMSFLRKIDGKNRLSFASIRDKETLKRYDINQEEAEKRMHTLRLKDRKMEKGIDSIQRIVKQIPLLWVLVPFLHVLISIGAGAKVYDWLAARRTILPVGGCEGGTCEIPKGGDSGR